jgi:hypothetical protein
MWNTPKQLMAGLCHVWPSLCQAIDEGVSPFDKEIDNLDRMADKFSKTPAGSGWRNLIHYAQIIKSKKFQRYDFGKT